MEIVCSDDDLSIFYFVEEFVIDFENISCQIMCIPFFQLSLLSINVRMNFFLFFRKLIEICAISKLIYVIHIESLS